LFVAVVQVGSTVGAREGSFLELSDHGVISAQPDSVAAIATNAAAATRRNIGFQISCIVIAANAETLSAGILYSAA
jgi:hypothetical protein